MSSQPLLFVITGSRGTGKTTFCLRMIEAARKASWQVSGVLSPPVFEGSRRTAIQVEDLHSGEVRQLATRRDENASGGALQHTRNWDFDPEVLAWGNQVLQASTPAQLLVVDELGTLEFEREQGWLAGLDAIDSRAYQVALVVIRSELLGDALVRWQDAHIVEIDTPEESRQKAAGLAKQLFK
jgi:nucleoside-triphosphatase THEP1